MRQILWCIVLFGDAAGALLFFAGLAMLRRYDKERKEAADMQSLLAQNGKKQRNRSFLMIFGGVAVALLTSVIYLTAVFL